MLHALLFIPADDPDPRRWMVTLWTYCMRCHYQPQAVVHSWCDVIKMVQAGLAEVVVVARRDHLDPKRTPRIEVVSEQPEPSAPTPSSRRRTGRM